MPVEKNPNHSCPSNFPPPREAIIRGKGFTSSEKYLSQLAEKSFLKLWSYPNLYVDRKQSEHGDGKELCDLLVVCGDDVLIFSDKTISWKDHEDVNIAWRRWCKRAIGKSADQVRGAERWITNFSERIFLDSKCTQPLPVRLPPPERRRVHGIVVALGVADACKKYFGDKRGSLRIHSDIKSSDHWQGDVKPFAVGDIDPNGSFIHVLDDATLDIVLRELDTITDFTDYLSKKEELIRSGRLASSAGEEELLAYYLMHMNSRGEHDFTKPDGSDLKVNEKISLGVGFYQDLRSHKQYRAKKKADRASYVWDRLIELFAEHLLNGTSVVPEGVTFNFSDIEECLRYMALVPRYLRRSLGEGISDVLSKSSRQDRFSRSFFFEEPESLRDTCFFFMTLAVPKHELEGGYAAYRHTRQMVLETYALALLKKKEDLKRVIGIATEPRGHRGGSSEDLIKVEGVVWTPELDVELEERKNLFRILRSENSSEYAIQGSEYPELKKEKQIHNFSGRSRQVRRKEASKARRASRKNRKSI